MLICLFPFVQIPLGIVLLSPHKSFRHKHQQIIRPNDAILDKTKGEDKM